MKNCPKCNVENKDEAKFCKGCRYSFVGEVAPQSKPDAVDHLISKKPQQSTSTQQPVAKPPVTKKNDVLVKVVVVSALVAIIVGVGVYFYSTSNPPVVEVIKVEEVNVMPTTPTVKEPEVIKEATQPLEVPAPKGNVSNQPVDTSKDVVTKENAQVPVSKSATVTSQPAPEVTKPVATQPTEAKPVKSVTQSTSKASSSAEANRQKLLELKRQLGQ